MLFCYELTRKILTGYDQVCATFCREQEIARTSFDILLFLANNPAYNTARDIVQVRHLKANLVSIHLDRLEEEGYLVRTAVAGDRRKRALRLTESHEVACLNVTTLHLRSCVVVAECLPRLCAEGTLL